MKLFSGESNKPLAQKIALDLGIDLGNVYHHEFPSNEKYCEFKESINGDIVVLIQSTNKPANDNLMQLLVMVDAAKRSEARKIVVVLPYFCYARQDRKDEKIVPISAKLVMNMLESAGVDHIITMDLHASQIVGFTDLPCDNLHFINVMCNYIKSKYIDRDIKKKLVVLAPDAGAIKNSQKYADILGCELAIINKKRKNDETVTIENFIGNVHEKDVFIPDDLTESCGTLVEAAIECSKRRSNNIYCGVTHGCLTDVGMKRLYENTNNRIITEFIQSDTVLVNWINNKKSEYITELSVSELFADRLSKLY